MDTLLSFPEYEMAARDSNPNSACYHGLAPTDAVVWDVDLPCLIRNTSLIVHLRTNYLFQLETPIHCCFSCQSATTNKAPTAACYFNSKPPLDPNQVTDRSPLTPRQVGNLDSASSNKDSTAFFLSVAAQLPRSSLRSAISSDRKEIALNTSSSRHRVLPRPFPRIARACACPNRPAQAVFPRLSSIGHHWRNAKEGGRWRTKVSG
ncbi:hypothetical protein VTK26DRAFT_1616 [Humicola hyalothermophila]